MRILLILAAAACFAQTAEELDSVARVATVMVDGDVCQRIVTRRAMAVMLDPKPRDKWLASDDYDVNQDAFIQTKKTLARLAKLVAFPADVNLWMPLPGKPGRIHIAVRGVNETSQFWPWGALTQDTPAPMQKVLDSGERVTAREKPGIISVLAPVRNSLGDIIGLVEVVARTKPNAHENVK